LGAPIRPTIQEPVKKREAVTRSLFDQDVQGASARKRRQKFRESPQEVLRMMQKFNSDFNREHSFSEA
jgi:hypothetical protein